MRSLSSNRVVTARRRVFRWLLWPLTLCLWLVHPLGHPALAAESAGEPRAAAEAAAQPTALHGARPADTPTTEGRPLELPPLPRGFETKDAGWLQLAYPSELSHWADPLLTEANQFRAL